MDIGIERLTITYGDLTAVRELDLDVHDGESLVLLGPSGCGKTSMIRGIAGLEQSRSGRITIGNRVIADPERGISVPTHKRQLGMVFQSYAVWPHMTVAQNVGFPLKMQGESRKNIRTRVDEMLELVGLEDYADRGASKLSGGQMQRVALARSLVTRPSVLLLDEPLSNLDAKLRDQLRFELREIQQETEVTTIFVTHDQQEALVLADRIAVMRDGVIVQLAPPKELYQSPRSVFVADFLGIRNIFDGKVTNRGQDGRIQVQLPTGVSVLGMAPDSRPAVSPGDQVAVAIRPETIEVFDPKEVVKRSVTDHNRWEARVQLASFLGSQMIYRLDVGPNLELDAAAGDMSHSFHVNDEVVVGVDPADILILPAETEA